MNALQITACCTAVLVALLLPACSLFEGDATFGGDGVTATATGTHLVITNNTDAEVWTFVVGRNLDARILWQPGVEGKGLAPGARKRIRYDDISRSEDEEEVIVSWWHAVEEEGERVPGEIRSFVAEL